MYVILRKHVQFFPGIWMGRLERLCRRRIIWSRIHTPSNRVDMWIPQSVWCGQLRPETDTTQKVKTRKDDGNGPDRLIKWGAVSKISYLKLLRLKGDSLVAGGFIAKIALFWLRSVISFIYDIIFVYQSICFQNFICFAAWLIAEWSISRGGNEEFSTFVLGYHGLNYHLYLLVIKVL